MFESIDKTNTTQTYAVICILAVTFESIAKTNTTQTEMYAVGIIDSLRVLLKQIQHKHWYQQSELMKV